jgi:hypothetical protein
MGPVFWLACALGAVGPVLVGPLFISRVCGDLPPRAATAVASAWVLLTMSFRAFQVAFDWRLSPSFAWIGAGSALVLGVALLVGARRLDRVLHPPDEPTPTKF